MEGIVHQIQMAVYLGCCISAARWRAAGGLHQLTMNVAFASGGRSSLDRRHYCVTGGNPVR